MSEPTISVGILVSDKITFELHGDFMTDIQTDLVSGPFTASLNEGNIIIENGDKKLTVSDEISFTPSDFKLESFVIKNVIIGVDFHWEQKETQRFKGTLKFLKEKGRLTAVNVLPIEEYLLSVISSEMSAKSSIELLKAHSIISRSWLLSQIEKSREIQNSNTEYQSASETEDELIKWYDKEEHIKFDVCADDHCQRYQGITKAYTDTVKKAINETYGIVLMHEGRICDTRYSKSCGGISEAFENVWEPVKYPYLSAIVDYKFDPENLDSDLTQEANAEKWIRSNPPAFCNTTDSKILSQVLNDYDQTTVDFYRWKVEYTQTQIAELINSKSGIDFGDIIDLIPIERGQSARLIKLKIVGSKKTFTIGKELEIRRILSKSHLYSSAFVVDKEEIAGGVPQKFILTGAGWGHGVGLCQIGAAVMGEMGYKFDEILVHYFKGAKLKKIY
jgi:SpoIID/LytB domain protein